MSEVNGMQCDGTGVFCGSPGCCPKSATPPATPSSPQAGGQEVQNIMFEVFEYAKLSEGIDKAEGEARAYQRDAMFQQDRKIRSMIADLAAPVAPQAVQESICEQTGDGLHVLAGDKCLFCDYTEKSAQVKPWQERAKEANDFPVFSGDAAAKYMEAEIKELRAALAAQQEAQGVAVRDRFEEFANLEACPIARDGDGYKHPRTQTFWTIWQAALRSHKEGTDQ